ncbi:hypothetical protein HPB47_002959 [Ixodes persulcatus]|uniref:Uncharacterized protein n=1 Tax=Ixodes persulcatus TaxID=34615 RepID=A0AC60PJS5_IXOPE|nr:hypothetical protein HPB47_002959 [Ixodes persulcatus]
MFVCRAEALYGKAATTFNKHLLLHLASCVCNVGTPWALSAFVFEGGSGTLVNLVSAAKGLPQQVVERVVMAQELKLLLASHHLPNREGRICHGFLGRPICDKESNLSVDYLQFVNGKLLLKRSHSYYTQVQVSPYVLNLSVHHFFVH